VLGFPRARGGAAVHRTRGRHQRRGLARLRGRRGLATVLALVTGAGLLVAVGSGALMAALAGQAAVVPQVSGILNPVLPQRILDTRTTTGGHHSKLGSNATMRLSVLNGGGLPGAGVSAVLLNVTAVDETASGYLTFYPSGTTRPSVSTLNYASGTSIANQALVPVGSDGTISIYNNDGQADVIVDVEGWVGANAAAANGTTTTAAPTRILDTRTATGGHQAPLANGQSLTLQVEGAGPVPATGVSAVYANVVGIPVGNSAGYLTAYPSDAAAPPVTSTVSFMGGSSTANLTLLPVSATGTVTITNHSPDANVIVDVAGWTSGGDVTTDAGIQPVPATRILDTRTTTGGHDAPLGSNSTLSVPVLGTGGVPSTGVAAVVVHLTAVNQTQGTYLTAYGTGYPRPGSSVLNAHVGQTVSVTAVVPVGPTGAISVYNPYGSVNVLIDVQGWIAAPTLTVVPPSTSALSAGTPTTAAGKQALSILTNANRYAMTTWWNTIYPTLIAAPMRSSVTVSPDDVAALTYSAATVSTTDSVRRLIMEAYSLATAIGTGAYNPTATGVPTATATSRTVTIISRVTAGHVANATGGWGATSESMFYAAYLGAAAWMIWPDLTATQQSQVAKMVYFEAEWGMDRPLEFYANAAGTILQPGDTGSDQDSWYPMADQLATVMMPGNAHLPFWQNTVVRNALAAWARPSDDNNGTVVNGASVATWLGNRGSNILSSGALYNHNRIAPDYSTLITQNMQDILLTAMAGQAAPQAVRSLVAPVYDSYAGTSYASPPYDKPGGTVYPRNNKVIYYPQGCDWGTGQEIPYALTDAEVTNFGVGTGTSAAYENLHAATELAMQQAHSDGHTYDSDTQYKYVGREEHVSQQAAQLYLTQYIRAHALDSYSNTSYWLAP
jgi:hypothetical protein